MLLFWREKKQKLLEITLFKEPHNRYCHTTTRYRPITKEKQKPILVLRSPSPKNLTIDIKEDKRPLLTVISQKLKVRIIHGGSQTTSEFVGNLGNGSHLRSTSITIQPPDIGRLPNNKNGNEKQSGPDDDERPLVAHMSN